MTKRLIDLDDELLARRRARPRVRGRLPGCVRGASRRWQIPVSGLTCGGDRRFLIDTSAAARMPLPTVADRLEPLITGGLVGTCAALDAEALYSARSPAEYEQVRSDRRDAYEYVPTDEVHWRAPSTRSAHWL